MEEMIRIFPRTPDLLQQLYSSPDFVPWPEKHVSFMEAAQDIMKAKALVGYLSTTAKEEQHATKLRASLLNLKTMYAEGRTPRSLPRSMTVDTSDIDNVDAVRQRTREADMAVRRIQMDHLLWVQSTKLNDADRRQHERFDRYMEDTRMIWRLYITRLARIHQDSCSSKLGIRLDDDGRLTEESNPHLDSLWRRYVQPMAQERWMHNLERAMLVDAIREGDDKAKKRDLETKKASAREVADAMELPEATEAVCRRVIQEVLKKERPPSRSPTPRRQTRSKSPKGQPSRQGKKTASRGLTPPRKSSSPRRRNVTFGGDDRRNKNAGRRDDRSGSSRERPGGRRSATPSRGRRSTPPRRSGTSRS